MARCAIIKRSATQYRANAMQEFLEKWGIWIADKKGTEKIRLKKKGLNERKLQAWENR